MRSSILALPLAALLVACTSGTNPGDSCSTKDKCSDGQVCDLTAPEGAVCLESAGDVDGDGLTNDKDFCQHAAGGAFDEDGDGFGDECDPCPIAAPLAKAETDGDAVEGICDPNPTMAGEKVAAFAGFNGALPPGATATNAAVWTVAGGEVVMTPANAGTLEQLTVRIPMPSNRLAILTSYRIEQIAAGATQIDAGVVGFTHLPQGDAIVKCGANRALGDVLRVESNSGVNVKPATNLFESTAPYRVAEQIDGGTISCALIGTKETAAAQTNSAGDQMSEIGVYARGATVRFSYVLAVQR